MLRNNHIINVMVQKVVPFGMINGHKNMSDDSLSLILSSHGRTWDHLDVWLGTKPRSHEDREMDQHDVAVNEHGFIMIYSCQVMSAIKNI